MFELVLSEAEFHFKKLGISKESLEADLHILRNAFGEVWIKEQLEKKLDPLEFNSNLSQLIQWMKVSGETQILSIFELSTYLKDLYKIKKIDDVIQMLKVGDQFDSAFMQMAYAYRFKQIEVEDLAFEPDTDKGRKADIYFNFENVHYVVECFQPRNSSELGYELLFKKTAEECFELSNSQNRRFLIFVEFKEEYSQLIRKQIEYEIKKVLSSSVNEITISNNSFNITIINTTDMDDIDEDALFKVYYEDSTCGLNTHFVDKKDLEKLRRGENVSRRPGTRFLAKFPQDDFDFDKAMEKLCRKVEKKVSQTRKSDLDGEVRGIILLGSSIAKNEAWGSKDFQQRLDRLESKILLNHKDISGILLVDRMRLEGKNSMSYGGFLLESNQCELSKNLFTKLIRFEDELDVCHR